MIEQGRPPFSGDPAGAPDAAPIGHRLRHRRRRRRHALAAAVAVIGLTLTATAAALVVVAEAPDKLVGCHLATTHVRVVGADTRLLAGDGTTLGFVPTGQNREPVTLAHISPWLVRATVAIEDRRFWSHGALDLVGVARSAFADATAGRFLQGASTITQQLVRNRYLSRAPMTLGRKLDEACLAVQLFRRWPRARILEAYLNTVSYGAHARGVQAAAYTYFGLPASRLSLPQAALIAGLPQAPSQDDPFRDANAALGRRAQVLSAMRRAGELSPAAAAAAAATPLGLRPGHRYGAIAAPTFTDAARAELVRRLGGARVRHGGLRVHTTLRPRLQAQADRAIGHWIGAPGDPAAALVAIDPHTGDVLAAASRAPGVRRLRFDLATQAHRQAGSAFKVFTLTTALEHGVGLNSVWNGPPSLTIPDPRCENAGVPWTVHNFADETAGRMDLVQGIAHSVNTIFAQVAVQVGPPAIVRTAHRMGIVSPLTPVCSITLGPEGVSPLEMADAFATLAAGGIHHAPRLLDRVTDPTGASLLPSRTPGDRALPAGIASQVTAALSAVIHGGTGTAADPGRPAAGKTGTSERSTDAWFCGFVPQLAACVWIGHPRLETPMAAVDGFSPVVGGSVPARIWHDFMVAALAGRHALPMPQLTVSALPPSRGTSSGGFPFAPTPTGSAPVPLAPTAPPAVPGRRPHA